jgi:predicted Zn-dependent peptidase
MTDLHPSDDSTSVATLPNGVRVVAIRLPQLQSASVSVFVRTGSLHESRRLNGISHFAEHMAFKGTHERDCQQINLDAERLGAEVNAHTDKDHTAYHMRGLARDAGRFVRMLGDIVRNSTFPEAELERERQVILQEYAEEEDDALATAFKLFDQNCFGAHPAAQPVIGTRGNIERFTRGELLGYVQRQYTGANIVVGVAGNVDPESIVDEARAAFGDLERGSENQVPPPVYVGGVKSRRQPGCSQTHVVLGFPIPALRDDYHPEVVAAALLGEGMSSPLMDRIRERLGLVYYAACSADVMALCGQFVIEASMAPENVDAFLVEATRLLAAHAEQAADPSNLERARNQIAVRRLHVLERPYRRLEEAAQDLFVHGRVRREAELTARVQSVTAAEVRDAFERMLARPASLALAGRVGARFPDRARELAASLASGSR